MSSSLNFKIMPFTIKLKYNVGESKQTQYLDIEKFSYEKIKNAEMVEKQKEKYIKSKEKDYEISLNEYYEIHKGKNRATLKTEFDSSVKGIAAIKQKQWKRDNDHFDGLHDYIYNKKKMIYHLKLYVVLFIMNMILYYTILMIIVIQMKI